MAHRLFRLLVVLCVLAILAVAAVFVISNTDFGRERAKRFVVGLLSDQTHGIVTVGTLHGNLLSGATLVSVSITDSAKNPFLKADSISLRYVVRSFLSSRLNFDDVTLYHPEIVVARKPGGEWNYRILWPAGKPKAPGDTSHSWGDWVSLTNVTVVNGFVTARSPWAPRTGLTARVRDSVIKDALGAGSRLYIAQVEGGFQKVITLERLNGKLPEVRWADPKYKTRLLRVSALAMDAFPFRPPPVQVRGLTGSFEFNDDSLWWKGANVALPHTAARGDGVYNLNSGDMRLTALASPASFADFGWLYPHLPKDGGGTLGLAVQWKGATQDYVIQKANLHAGGAHFTGDVGVSIADTIFFHDANVRFTGVTTKQIEDAAPGLKLPRRGVLSGQAQFAGTFKRMQLANTDITFDAFGRGISRVQANGMLGFEGTKKIVVVANNLRVRVEPLQIDIVKLLFPTLPIGGTLSGTTTLDGRGDTQLRFSSIDIVHVDGNNVSHAVGSASSHTTGRQTLDLDVEARPIALAELTKFAPTLPLKGLASGPFHAHGPLDWMDVDTRLNLPGGGQFALKGKVDFLSADLGYDVAMDANKLDLSWVVLFGPRTQLTGTALAKGRGFKPETMTSEVVADFGTSKLDTVAVDSVSIRTTIAGGIADVEKFYARGSGVRLDVNGQFGLDSLRSGTLNYALEVDSIGTVSRFIPGNDQQDTTVTVPRPRATFERFQRARADSMRVARSTEISRMLANLPPVKLQVPKDTARAIPRSQLSGSVKANGTLTGSLDVFSVKGTAKAESLVVQGNSVRHLAADYNLENVLTKKLKVDAKVRADTVSAGGFLFDSLAADGNYLAPNGSLSVRVIQGAQREYSLNGDFTVDTARNEVRLADVGLRFDSTTWKSTHPATIHFGASGIEVINLELMSGPGRRIYANGLLPTKGTANFDLQITDFAVENVAELLQSDVPLAGRISLDAHVTGVAEDPRVSGKVDFVKGTYNAVSVPEVHGTFNYANKQLVTNASAVDSTGKKLASLDGTIPIDLALSGVTGSRLLDLPVNANVASDSLPLGLISNFTTAVSEISGKASGKFTVTGTLKKPALNGNLNIDDVHVKLAATGTSLDHMNGVVRMTGDTVHVDSLVARANGPIRVAGNISVGNLKEPAFNLTLNATDAELLNNETGEIHADASLSLTGKFTAPSIVGNVTVLHGVLYIPESKKKIIGAGDPNLFNVVDTAVKLQRELFPAESPMFKNLHADVQLSVERNTWVRSRDANVEIFTEEPVSVNVVGDAIALTGAVDADQGEYTFLSKRFQIKRGTALFIGTPDLNPTLQITAEYVVKQPTGVTNIQVLIGGTIETPRISLESDAQPPLSQSDLLAYLAFGERSTSLLQFNQSSADQGNLISVASSRLVGVALGVMLDDLKGSATRSYLDVFAITPGDFPVSQNAGGFDQFLKGTEVEAGKYINPRTFVSTIVTPGIFACSGGTGNTSCATPGVSFTQRTAKGYRFELNYSPRYFLNPPTLEGQTYASGAQFGAFVIREWRF